MSIDGPGILASDLAHDVYNQVMDWWDADVSFDQICERLRNYDDTTGELVDVEIFLAARVKAFWEIGQLPVALRDALRRMVDEGASLSAWADGGDAALARQRRAALERLLKQAATPKARPRPRRKHAKVRDKLHAEGDCLTLQAGEAMYFGVVCQVSEYRGQCDYVMIVMAPLPEATREAFEAGQFFGHFIGTADGMVAGPHVMRLDHRMLVREGNPFRVVAHVDLDPGKFRPGSWGGILSLAHVIDDFERTLTEDQSVFGRRSMRLAALLR